MIKGGPSMSSKVGVSFGSLVKTYNILVSILARAVPWTWSLDKVWLGVEVLISTGGPGMRLPWAIHGH